MIEVLIFVTVVALQFIEVVLVLLAYRSLKKRHKKLALILQERHNEVFEAFLERDFKKKWGY